MKSLLLILALQTLTGDGWLFLETAYNKHGVAQAFINPKTIQRNGDIVKVGYKLTFPVGSYLTELWRGSALMPDVSSVKGALTFNCKKQILVSGESYFYNRADEKIEKYKHRERVKEKPGTISWLAFEYLCERPQEKRKTPPRLSNP